MKIIFCTYDGKNVINGVNVWLLNLLPQLQNKGLEVGVIVLAWSPEDECTTIPLLRAANIEYAVIKGKRYTQVEVKLILDYVQAKQPDVFVCNNVIQACFASKWIQQAGIATVAVLHNDNAEYDGILEEFASEKNGYRFSAIVAVSEILKYKLSLYTENIIKRKIACGVPVPSAKNTFKSGQIFKISYIGRLAVAQKNITKVIRAFCEIVTELPDVEAYVYGSGPDIEIIDQVRNEFDYPKRVILKGNLPPAEIQSELTKLHAITLMSDYEGLPVSLMEAMAVGVVPICTRIKSGVPELVIENVTGLYIDEPGQLKDKIKYLKDNPDVWDELSSNAKAHIEKKFSSQITDQLWLDLLNEVMPVEKKQIKIPARIILPPVNKNISLEDNREPSQFVKAVRKIKRIISRLTA